MAHKVGGVSYTVLKMHPETLALLLATKEVPYAHNALAYNPVGQISHPAELACLINRFGRMDAWANVVPAVDVDDGCDRTMVWWCGPCVVVAPDREPPGTTPLRISIRIS